MLSKKFIGFLAGAFIALSSASVLAAQSKECYKVATSPYVGWEFIAMMQQFGILKKHADKQGVCVEIKRLAKYGDTIQQYSTQSYHGIAITNMDAMIAPAAGGIHTEVILMGDTSNGNDGTVLRDGNQCQDLKGRVVRLMVGTVSQFFLFRNLESCGLKMSDVKMVNTDDDKIVSAYQNDSNKKAALVSWHPYLMQLRLEPKTTMIFDSSKIPGEIMDMVAVRTGTPDKVKRALVGAWYEALALFNSKTPRANETLTYMAKISEATTDEFKAQLKTTNMFWTPKDALGFVLNPNFKVLNERVREVSFKAKLFDPTVKTKDVVGILYPDGSVSGDKNNVKLHFNPTYMQLAADGRL